VKGEIMSDNFLTSFKQNLYNLRTELDSINQFITPDYGEKIENSIEDEEEVFSNNNSNYNDPTFF